MADRPNAALAQIQGLAPDDVPFTRFTKNSGISMEGVKTLSFSNLKMREVAGFALIVNHSSGVKIDRIVVASSSGGTQAGLVVGRALAEADVSILGVDVDGEPDELLAMVQSVARDCAEKVGLRRDLPDGAFELVRDYAAPGYGLPNPGMIEAVTWSPSTVGTSRYFEWSDHAMVLVCVLPSGRCSTNSAGV